MPGRGVDHALHSGRVAALNMIASLGRASGCRRSQRSGADAAGASSSTDSGPSSRERGWIGNRHGGGGGGDGIAGFFGGAKAFAKRSVTYRSRGVGQVPELAESEEDGAEGLVGGGLMVAAKMQEREQQQQLGRGKDKQENEKGDVEIDAVVVEEEDVGEDGLLLMQPYHHLPVFRALSAPLGVNMVTVGRCDAAMNTHSFWWATGQNKLLRKNSSGGSGGSDYLRQGAVLPPPLKKGEEKRRQQGDMYLGNFVHGSGIIFYMDPASGNRAVAGIALWNRPPPPAAAAAASCNADADADADASTRERMVSTFLEAIAAEDEDTLAAARTLLLEHRGFAHEALRTGPNDTVHRERRGGESGGSGGESNGERGFGGEESGKSWPRLGRFSTTLLAPLQSILGGEPPEQPEQDNVQPLLLQGESQAAKASAESGQQKRIERCGSRAAPRRGECARTGEARYGGGGGKGGKGGGKETDAAPIPSPPCAYAGRPFAAGRGSAGSAVGGGRRGGRGGGQGRADAGRKTREPKPAGGAGR